jgi:tetratricopeptide (TPR) repeat protein
MALASYDRVLAVHPGHVEVLCNRGVTLHQLNRLEDALASYDRALALRPDYPEALSNRGNTLRALKQSEEASISYRRALALRPDYAEALCNLGVVLHEQKQFGEALASYDRAVAARPAYAKAFSNRGVTLKELRRFSEALTSLDCALALQPDYAEALCNRGATLHELKRFDEALACYDRALVLRPDYVHALCNRGVTLQALLRFEEALADYDRAAALQPDCAEAHFNEALTRLLVGDFNRGLEKYEWRWETEQKEEKREFKQPRWRGSRDIADKTILLYAEQGFGDAIQFCRYVPLVAALGPNVILEVQRPLLALMETLKGGAKIVSRGDPVSMTDLECPLLSLPLAFDTRLETTPSETPYLDADPLAAAAWKARLGSQHRRKVGIVWSGSPTHRNDHNRSIGLAALLPLLDLDITFISLTKVVNAEDAALIGARGIPHFGDELHDFADTAALISNLDLVISVDTSVAHLAGALAKSVWILLPFLPDWRWQLDRDDSLWYPTARLFRQDETQAWDGVIARVHAALREIQ